MSIYPYRRGGPLHAHLATGGGRAGDEPKQDNYDCARAARKWSDAFGPNHLRSPITRGPAATAGTRSSFALLFSCGGQAAQSRLVLVHLDKNTRPMTDPRPNVSVGKGSRLDRGYDTCEGERIAVLGDQTCQWDGIDRDCLACTRTRQKCPSLGCRQLNRKRVVAVDSVRERPRESVRGRARREAGIAGRPRRWSLSGIYGRTRHSPCPVTVKYPDALNGERGGERRVIDYRLEIGIEARVWQGRSGR